MKKLYFDLDNGKVVEPRNAIAPAYYVIVDHKNIPQSVYTCFSKKKIELRGDGWVKEGISNINEIWSVYHWLNSSLIKYVEDYSYLSEKQNYESEYKDDFVYLKFKDSQ